MRASRPKARPKVADFCSATLAGFYAAVDTLTSITPVVVGGTILAGGRGGVIGTLLGVYLISLLNNVLNFMDISSHYQQIVQGLIVIVAVSVYVEKKRKL
ncbi:ABC transporter permease [Phaeobacter inhibens]|jgi:ribose transport system permease protein|uniref:Putative sugar transport system, permease protein n=1 Tax=Phaeobacter inhibens TaxID=221822 RepID=A0A2I7KGC9_9RHOB|nr:hypothetical protein [Phaeobacter inhibens]AUR01636.1 putative sugar transport system, permease protein [Phaeobacter inhibens]